MKKLSAVFVALCVSVSITAAFAKGGGGSHHSSLGSTSTAPGTNSSGTALSSGGVGNGAQKGPLLGTTPAIDREDAKVEKMIKSICRGC
jgi:hypothetical protein